MPDLDRRQLAVYLVAGLAIVLIGARFVRTGGTPAAAPVVSSVSPQPATAPGGGAGLHLARVSTPAVVDVTGAVRRPGVYRLADGARVQDAVQRAGGASSQANLEGLNLAAKVQDGAQILVPRRGPAGVAAAGPAGAVSGPGAAGAASTTSGPPVNLNIATAEQLGTLDGVGPATARKILDYRTQHGGFGSVDELDQVSGIGPKKLAALRPGVTV